MIISENIEIIENKKHTLGERGSAQRTCAFVVDDCNSDDLKKGLDHSGGTRKNYKLINSEGDGESVDVVIRDSGVELFKKVVRNVVRAGGAVENSLSMGMSKRSARRLMKRTLLLEAKGYKPSHMLTVTLPPERWEKLSSNDERVEVWKRAKKIILDRLRKMIASFRSCGCGVIWFQEFQKRGAPHLHIIINIGELNNKQWEYWLNWFINVWSKAIKMENLPSQAVDFSRMKHNDFRYCRAYAGKVKQKDAPFRANWGKWWSCMGEWNNVKDNVKGTYTVEMDKIDKFLKGIPDNKKLDTLKKYFIDGRITKIWIIRNEKSKEAISELEVLLPNSCKQQVMQVAKNALGKP